MRFLPKEHPDFAVLLPYWDWVGDIIMHGDKPDDELAEILERRIDSPSGKPWVGSEIKWIRGEIESKIAEGRIAFDVEREPQEGEHYPVPVAEAATYADALRLVAKLGEDSHDWRPVWVDDDGERYTQLVSYPSDDEDAD